jgi:hypothetical protein
MHIVNHAKYGNRKYALKIHPFVFVIVIDIFDIGVIFIFFFFNRHYNPSLGFGLLNYR